MRLSLIQKTLNGHSALLGGIYPKKNLLNLHSETESIELIRRNTKQLLMYDNFNEKKQILRYTSQVKRSKSGDAKILNILPQSNSSIQNMSNTSHFLDYGAANLNQTSQLNKLKSERNTTLSPTQKNKSLGNTTVIFNITNIELNKQCSFYKNPSLSELSSSLEKSKLRNTKSMHTNKKKIDSQGDRNSSINSDSTNQNFLNQDINKENQNQFLKSNEQLKQNTNFTFEESFQKNSCVLNGVNYQHLQLQIDNDIKKQDDNLNNCKLSQSYKRNSLIKTKKSTSQHLKNEIFSNEKLKVFCNSSENLEKETITQDLTKQASNKIIQQLEKKKNMKIQQPNKNLNNSSQQFNVYQGQYTQSSMNMNSEISYGNLLLNSSLNNTLVLQQQNNDALLQSQQNSIEMYAKNNRFKHISDGIVQNPQQAEIQYKELYKLNLIEDFKLQSDNYQKFYQRHYFRPNVSIVKNRKKSQASQYSPSASNSNFYQQRNKNENKRDFNLMYSNVPDNQCTYDQSFSRNNSITKVRKQQTSSNFNQTKKKKHPLVEKSKSLENTPKNVSGAYGFIFKDVLHSLNQEQKERNDYLRSQYRVSGLQEELEDLENIIKKKQEICLESQKHLIPHLNDYQQDQGHMPFSKEENQAISEQLVKLLRNKFGKNPQSISTTDWRYNTKFNLNTENDSNSKSQLENSNYQLHSHRRKSVLALKHKLLQLIQKGKISLGSPKNSEQKQNYGTLSNFTKDLPQEESIQSLMDQILYYRYISKVQDQNILNIDSYNNQISENNFNNNELYQTKHNYRTQLSPSQNRSILYNQINLNEINNPYRQTSPVKFSDEKSQFNQNPSLTVKKQKLIVPQKTLNDTSYLEKFERYNQSNEKFEQKNSSNISDEQQFEQQFNNTYKYNDDNIQENISYNYENTDQQLDHQSQNKKQLKNNQTAQMVEQDKKYNYKTVTQDQLMFNDSEKCTYHLTSKIDILQNQKVIQNKQFVPFACRKSNNTQQKSKSPTRPKRVVNIKVKYDASPTLKKLNQNNSMTEKISESQSPEKQHSMTQKQQSYEKIIPQLLIKQIPTLSEKKEKREYKPYKPLSQVEIWDSRMFTLPEDFNQTFYQLNSSLKAKKMNTFYKV